MNNKVVLGLLLLIAGNLFSALYDVSIKWLPSDTNATTFLLVRQITSIFILMPFWLWVGKPQPQQWGIHWWRANIGAVGALGLVIGIMALPLASVSALFYTAPLMIMVLGYVFLKERVTLGQWGCALLGMIGVVLILKPGAMAWAGIAVLFSAFTFAICQLTLRKMSFNDHPIVPLMLYNLLALPLVLLMAVVQGIEGLSWSLLMVAVASNVCLLVYHWFCVLAYRQAQAGEIAIAEYSGLLFIVFFGWLLFDEWLDNLAWLGAALVVLPSLLLPQLKKLRRLKSAQLGVTPDTQKL
ncbi:DMT family transporter [Shewanella sp. NIFS-20-20]|uniref:DMT family transporter n=1 Tax=Shewanella sp. NIFS-20-20 TaxID=2853806 RepID=UPI001C46CDE1|nr:DMT family transporter [Shewanella sp. NIFS-20-20]MBV7315640.1 DMT family transporter [Shewanella sp. NIFS-20-20]